MKFAEVKQKIIGAMVDANEDDSEAIAEVCFDLNGANNCQELSEALDAYGFSLTEACCFILNQIVD